MYEFARTTAWYSPQAQEALAVSASESDAMLVGRIAADVATIVVGVSEFSGGLTIASGGVIAGCAATLCIASPVAAAVGAGVAAVGVSTATAGAVGLGGNLALINGKGEPGLITPTGSSFTIKDLVISANQPDRNGLTYAGRALQKHGNRPGSAFPNVIGKPAQYNSLGSSIVEGILNDPGSTFTNINRKGYGNVLEVISPDGRGVRYNATTGEFIGFLEP